MTSLSFATQLGIAPYSPAFRPPAHPAATAHGMGTRAGCWSTGTLRCLLLILTSQLGQDLHRPQNGLKWLLLNSVLVTLLSLKRLMSHQTNAESFRNSLQLVRRKQQLLLHRAQRNEKLVQGKWHTSSNFCLLQQAKHNWL